MTICRSALALLFGSLLALTACVGASAPELNAIGITTTNADVDFVAIYGFAGRARTAYKDDDTIRASYPATKRIGSPGKTDVRYFLEQDDRQQSQTVTIRGTASKANVHEDIEIRIRPDRLTGIPVHDGFDATTLAIYADVKPLLKPGYKTYVTGHSLGGAVAALLAIYLIEDGHKVVQVVTFGQPKFTTAAGVAKLGFLPITRVVDENDVVPMLPPTTLFTRSAGPYQHIGPEVMLLEGPHFAFLPVHDAARISLDELERSLRIARFGDHHMEHYVQRLSPKVGGAVEVPYAKREQYVAKKPKGS
jgi:hypothetical protein